ncbi:MAG: phosphoribosyltransferase [Bacteroidales bacterium]|nr:phosphoribosyltransferase [Bacteroidales bacterium]MEE0453371.1 phosphoribosyltransferase [Sodaliphilus sp.]
MQQKHTSKPKEPSLWFAPKRRHKERNFATLIAMRIAEMLGLPFFEDCAFAPSKHRVGTVFTANNIPPQRNIIVFDDFVTTGQTLVSMQNLLVSLGKNCSFFAGINNKL